VDTFNWMTYLNLPDFGGKGNLAGLYIGQPPRITSSDLPAGLNIPGIDADGFGSAGGRGKSTTHIEAFYRMRISDRIAITPGVMVILNPAGSNSDTILVGALRTTFSF
jgi:Carbohydrate-selective porin, OprB family